MSVEQILGYARSLLDSLGLTNFIIAFMVIFVAISLARRFTGSGD